MRQIRIWKYDQIIFLIYVSDFQRGLNWKLIQVKSCEYFVNPKLFYIALSIFLKSSEKKKLEV